VKVLVEAGAEVKPDRRGLTPLHVAAATTEPNPKIAKQLIKRMKQRKTNLDTTVCENNSDESTRGNTALHFAAGNKHMSSEFIQRLGKIDPSIKNRNSETAFHIAARAANPDIIVTMLELFTPAKKGWEMKSIETENRETLIETCAKRGNARAVFLLIKYGADISDKVLFYLIDESANKPNPTKTDKLIAVYRAITENCVLWDWLRNSLNRPDSSDANQHCPRQETEPGEFRETQRKIMSNLLTNKYYRDRNVLEYAIVKGDRAFLNEIVNTPNVFKIQENDAVKYEITGFLNVSRNYGSLFQYIRTMYNKRTAKIRPAETQPPSTAADVVVYSAPKRSYLQLITENRHLWENSDILQSEPFLSITQPICGFVQLIYFAMAVIQLVHMIVFTIYYMPHCSAKHHLYLDILNHCNTSTFRPEHLVVNVSQNYARLNSLWLVWPTAIFVVTLFIRFRWEKIGQTAYGYFTARLVFAPLLWAWYFKTFVSHELSIPLTSVVYLFGWLVTLSFFVYTSENASIFSFLLKKIIVKDIALTFGIVFVFILISFSSAVHALRESSLSGEKEYFDTVYSMFASALTTGNFIDETTEYSTDDMVRFHLFRALFAIYLCCATIILLNILISHHSDRKCSTYSCCATILLNILITMMNNRYEEARKTAKNVWRFQTIHSWKCLVFISGITSQEVLHCFDFYWKLQKFWKYFVHTTYDEVTITEDGEKVFLNLK